MYQVPEHKVESETVFETIKSNGSVPGYQVPEHKVERETVFETVKRNGSVPGYQVSEHKVESATVFETVKPVRRRKGEASRGCSKDEEAGERTAAPTSASCSSTELYGRIFGTSVTGMAFADHRYSPVLA